MSVQPAAEASTAIVRDTIRDGLRDAVDDTAHAFDDPRSSRNGSRFVVTSYPDRNTEHPHVVVTEAGDTGGRLDSRVDLVEHDFDVRAEIHARSSTETFNIRDALRAWFQASVESFRSAGWHDVEIVSTTPIDHQGDVDLKAWQITYTGTLYTET